MHVTKSDVTELSHGGTRYTPDSEGRIEVPAELGAWLITVHGWTLAAAPEPSEAAPAQPQRKTRSKA